MPPAGSYTHYTEPFFGGGSVLFGLSGEGVSETVNDICEELSNFWNILRGDRTFLSFRRMVENVPLSEPLYNESSNKPIQSVDEIDRAVRFYIKIRQSRQGLGKSFRTPSKRLRRGMNENVACWLTSVEGLPEIHKRLKRVEIRNMKFDRFLNLFDHDKAFHYLDPPYVHESRTAKDAYKYEMSVEDHTNLLTILENIKGKFLLSGYPSDLYDTFAKKNGWNSISIKIDNKASSKAKKPQMTEVLWKNY